MSNHIDVAEATNAYKEAQKRIKKAQKTFFNKGDVVVDFSDLPLTRLPPEIGGLTHLAIIEIGADSYKIGRFGKRSRPRLKNLPSSITRISNLQSLYLHANMLTALPSGFANLHKLTNLDISKNALEVFPADITRLRELFDLDLSDNQISDIPLEIGQLGLLRKLNLSGNRISKLPPQLGNLINLETLSLQNNRLTSLPDEIGLLKNLGYIDLRGNKLLSLPESLLTLEYLSILDLRDNPSLSIPQKFLDNIDSPNAILNYLRNRKSMSEMTPAELIDALRQYFNHDEFLDLLNELGINRNDIGGESTSAQMRNLVEMMVASGKFSPLENAVVRKRPFLNNRR